MDEVDVRELRYFIAVAEELNFTRAAARLGMAQPPLSAAIGKLERKLGVRLLERTSRRAALTPAGTVLLHQARLAVEGVTAAIERTRRAAQHAERLTLAVKPGTGTDLLQRTIHRYAQTPRMPQVHLLFGHPGGPADAVRAGVADVALLRAPFDQRGLDIEVLLVEPRVAVLPAGHRLASRQKLRRTDLAGELMPRWAGQTDPAAAAHWAGTDTPATASTTTAPVDDRAAPRPVPTINDMNQLLDAVALSDAVAYLPQSIAEQHRRSGLVFRPVTDLSPSRILLAWPDTSRSHTIASLVDTATQVAADCQRLIDDA